MACNGSKNAQASPEGQAKKEGPARLVSPPTYWNNFEIFKDGAFVMATAEEQPATDDETNKRFLRELYSGIRYPVEAREKGIGGEVVIAVVLDQQGQLEKAYPVKSVGYGCDEESLRMIKRIYGKGQMPHLVDGMPVRVRFEVPVRFRLE